MAIKHKVRKDDKGNMVVLSLTARKAIMHHCKECMGFQPREVKGCTAKLCALYPFRLHKTPKDTV